VLKYQLETDGHSSVCVVLIPLLRVFYIASFSKNSFESLKYEYPYYRYYKKFDVVVNAPMEPYEYSYHEY